jgi:hypothetical protein
VKNREAARVVSRAEREALSGLGKWPPHMPKPPGMLRNMRRSIALRFAAMTNEMPAIGHFSSAPTRASHARGRWFETSRAHEQGSPAAAGLSSSLRRREGRSRGCFCPRALPEVPRCHAAMRT